MVTNYYNASNNFSAPIRREPKPFKPQKEEIQHTEKNEECERRKECTRKGILEKIDNDTILILGLVILLVLSGSNDILLLVALGYILFF